MGFAYNIVAERLTAMDTRDRAAGLLRQKEIGIPQRVADALDYLDSHGIWYIVSRNSPATSCRDAASRRNRLGSLGIPLSDELKSHCVVYYDKKGERKYIILHCRGHRRFDLARVEKKLGAVRPLARLAGDELKRVFGSEYGTVTPFVGMKKVALQIFDEGVFNSQSPPHTMMTNAGDHTWGVEFKPRDLVDSLMEAYPEKILTDTIIEASNTSTEDKGVIYGIITGNGPESGMALWRHLNRYIAEGLEDRFKGDLSFPKVMIHSIPEMGLSMELEPRQEEVWTHLSRGVHQLCKNGATHIALACHTTHFFAEKIRNICLKYGTEFVSMAETTIKHIETETITDLTIIGIPYVSDLGDWSAYRPLSKINVHTVDERAREPMLELGYWVKKFGSDNQGLNKLNHILKMGVKTDSVLIALTEISVLLEGFPKKANKIGKWSVIDPLRLYGQRLAEFYLQSLPTITENNRKTAIKKS